MIFLGQTYVSIDSFITYQLVRNGCNFILFYLKYKKIFSEEFNLIFKRYVINYMSGELDGFNGVRHLLKIIHNNIYINLTINSENVPVYQVKV